MPYKSSASGIFVTKLKFPRQSSGWKGKRRGKHSSYLQQLLQCLVRRFWQWFWLFPGSCRSGEERIFSLRFSPFSSRHTGCCFTSCSSRFFFFTGRGSGSSLRVRLQPGQTFPFASDETHTGSHGMHVFFAGQYEERGDNFQHPNKIDRAFSRTEATG